MGCVAHRMGSERDSVLGIKQTVPNHRKIRRSGSQRKRRPASAFGVNTKATYINQKDYLSVVPHRKSGEEVKYVVSNLVTNFSSVSTTVQWLNLSGLIAAGTDLFNRLSRQVKLKGIKISGLLVGGQANTVTDEQYNTVRLMIVDAAGALTSSVSLNSVLDPRYVASLHKVYMDKAIALSSAGRDTSGYLPAIREFSVYVPINRIQEYNGTSAGSTTDLVLYMGMVTDSGAVPHPGFVNGDILIEFEDF